MVKSVKTETITFRCVDKITLEALAQLVLAIGPGVPGARSIAIRKAIINEAARIKVSDKIKENR
jgi:hypothetical protein